MRTGDVAVMAGAVVLFGVALSMCIAVGSAVAAPSRMAGAIAQEPLARRGSVAFAVVEPLQRGFRVSVIQRLQNATGRAIVATNQDPLVFPLPVLFPPPLSAGPVEFVGGWRNPTVAQGTITDTIPVLPGTMDVAYAFRFEPRARSATLRWSLPYGAMDVELLVAQGIRVSGIDLHAAGNLTEHGRRYARWSGGPVRPGAAISVRLDGLLVSTGRGPEIVAGVLALSLVCGLAAALIRPARPYLSKLCVRIEPKQ